MHFRESRTAVSAVLIVTVGLVLTACSGGGSTGTHTTTPANTSAPASTPGSTGEPTSGAAAVAAIKTNWAAFFDAKSPIAKRISLLENGTQFSSVIHAQAHSLLAREASSKATTVSLTGTKQAAVTYDILVSGSPVLKDQHGVAVYQDGVWKVGVVSFCGLLKVENNGKTSGLPPGCQG